MTVTRVPKPKGMKPDLWVTMVDAYSDGYRTTADMAVALRLAAKRGEILPSDIPPEYSLRRHVARLDEFYSSEPATLKDFPVEHSAYILEVLITMLDATEGRVSSFTRAEVQWIVRVHAAAPLMLPYEVYHFAREYWAQEKTGEPTASLDISLASFANWEEFSRAHDGGYLPPGTYPRFTSGKATSRFLNRMKNRKEAKL